VKSALRIGLPACLLWIAASLASADVVQGSVQPSGARVRIKDGAGNVLVELGSGPFQLRLPAGEFTAECVAPTAKTIAIFSLSVPTSVAIDCS
jgi:hypothetical protein